MGWPWAVRLIGKRRLVLPSGREDALAFRYSVSEPDEIEDAAAMRSAIAEPGVTPEQDAIPAWTVV